MKKILSVAPLTLLYALVAISLVIGNVFADDTTTTGTMGAEVPDIFSIEFFTGDANIIHGPNVPFTNINPANSLCYADGRSEGDGKSDVGILCSSNGSSPWYLKMAASTSTPSFPLANFKYYMGQPWDRNNNRSADGTLANSPAWYSVPTSAMAIYTSGPTDQSNIPYGTLATFSFGISPQGLSSGVTYSITVNYTLAQTP